MGWGRLACKNGVALFEVQVLVCSSYRGVTLRRFEVDILYTFFSLELHGLMGKITMELLLSAHVTVASLSCSLDCIIFIDLASCCVRLCLECELLFCFRVFMRSAARCLYMTRAELGSFDIAFSASKSMSSILFFCFVLIIF